MQGAWGNYKIHGQVIVYLKNVWAVWARQGPKHNENYEQMRSDNGRAHSPRCSIQMPKIFLRNDLKNLHKCINKKHPEQVKTDLTNLKVFWTFRRLDCTNSKGFQPSEELEKITAPASLHVTFIDSTQRLTRPSAVFFGYLPNIINDCYCRRSSYSPNKASPSSHLTSHIYSGNLAATEHSGASRSSTFCRWSSLFN